MSLTLSPSATFDTASSLQAINSFEHAVVSGGSNATGTSAFAIYTAQTGKRIVLREVTIANETATACSVSFTLSGGGSAIRTLYIPAGMTQQFAFYLTSATSATINRTVTATFAAAEAIRIGYGIEIHQG